MKHLCRAATIAAIVAWSAALHADPEPRVRVVAIYDSHGLTPFGEALDRGLLARGVELVSVTLGGASPSWILRRPVSPRGYFFESAAGKPITPRSRLPKLDLRTPVLEDLLHGAYDRQVVVITLGSNVPGEPSVQTAAVEEVVRRVNAQPKTACVWVGPPTIRNWSAGYADRVYAAIKDGIRAAGRPCRLVDSRSLTSYPPGGDGIHLGFVPSHVAVAERWASGVEDAIDRALADGRTSTIQASRTSCPR